MASGGCEGTAHKALNSKRKASESKLEVGLRRFIPLTVAAIHLKNTPRELYPELFSEAVSEIMGALESQGIKPGGSVVAYHLQPPSDTLDVELGVSIPNHIHFKPVGRVTQSSTLCWPSVVCRRL